MKKLLLLLLLLPISLYAIDTNTYPTIAKVTDCSIMDFDVVGITLDDTFSMYEDTIIVPKIILEEDSILKIIYYDTLELYFVKDFWNIDDITWYSLYDNKGNYYSLCMTRLNDTYYTMDFEFGNIKIKYDLKLIQ